MPVTRIDVEVSTDRAKQKLRELREEAERSGVNTKAITPTVDKVTGKETYGEDVGSSIKSIMREITQKGIQDISSRYTDIRSKSARELNNSRWDLTSHKITPEDYEKKLTEYRATKTKADTDEEKERNDYEKQQLERLSDILGELRTTRTEDNKQETVSVGRGKGMLEELFEKRNRLKGEQFSATSEHDIKSKGKEIDKVDKEIEHLLGRKSHMLHGINEAGQIGGELLEGNLGGAGSGVMQLLSGMGGTAALVAASVTAVAAVFGTAFMHGQELEKNASGLFALRSQGNKDDIIQNTLHSGAWAYGLDAETFMDEQLKLARTSGHSNDLQKRTMQSLALEKGYGLENPGQYSKLDRQNKEGKTSDETLLEMLNVLTGIKESGVTATDLTLINEKAATMFRLEGSVTSRQEKFETKDIVGIMAAFNKLGGSGSDQRSADFMENFMNAGREGGGNKNLELLKYEAARRMRPDLANDPYALSGIVEKGTDPKYMKAYFDVLKEAGGGNKQQEMFIRKLAYQGLTFDQRGMLDKLDFGTMLGKNYNPTGALSMNDADLSAKANTTVSQAAKELFMEAVVDKFASAVNTFVNGVVSPTTGKQPTPPAPTATNTVHGKKQTKLVKTKYGMLPDLH